VRLAIVALGGVSYAATVLPKNSVGTAQLQKKAVSRAKLKTNAVTTAGVKNGSLLAADFRAGQLPAGTQGPAGAQGPKGDKGEVGAAGAAGVSGWEIVVGAPKTILAGQEGYASVNCPAGKRPIGGGGGTGDGGLAISNTGPIDTGWFVDAKNTVAGAIDLRAYAICAAVG
jgi:hypothetical protein